MKHLLCRSLAVVLTFGAITSPDMGSAQAIRELTFKVSQANPRGHPLVAGAEKFAELVAAKSGRKMRLNVFPGGMLGSDAASVSALQGGMIEIAVLNSGILASQ